MRNKHNPRDDLAIERVHRTLGRGNSNCRILRVSDEFVAIPIETFVSLETLDTEFTIKADNASRQTPNNYTKGNHYNPHRDERIVPPDSTKPVGGSDRVFVRST
jgi:hypothetical protein